MQRVGRTMCSIFIDLLKVKQLCWKQGSYKKSIITGGLGGFLAIWILIRIWQVKVLKILYS